MPKVQAELGGLTVRSFKLLLHSGSASSPSARLVTAEADSTAEALARELLTDSPDGVGVEVWEDDQRLYARGVVPLRALRPETALGVSSERNRTPSRFG